MNHKERIEAYFADKEQTLIDAVSRLVAIRSVKGEPQPGMPFGPGPAAALEEALKLCAELGLKDPTNHEGYVGTADLNDKETALHILGHLDVVAEGEGWTVTEPYEPKVVDGCIFGRGTDDDKGPVVTALLAMKCVQDLGIPLKSNVRVIMGTDEESGSADIAHYFSKNPYAPNTFSPDSGFPVVNVEKGTYKPTFSMQWDKSDDLPRVVWLHGGHRINVLPGDASCAIAGLSRADMKGHARDVYVETGVRFTFEQGEDGLTIIHAKGVGSHAAWPQGGCNAITGLISLLARLPLAYSPCSEGIRALNELLPHGDWSGKALGIAQSDEVSGELTLSFTLLEITETGMEGRFDSRVPLCANQANCADVAAAAFESRGFTITGSMGAGHHTPAESPFVQTLLQCYESYTGLKGECLMTGGGTYVHNIPGGVAFGCSLPGFDTKLHGADERARISDLMVSCKIFAQVIAEMCGE